MIPNCECGKVEGKKTILNNAVVVGVNTELDENGVFVNHRACTLENNYCPQCGTKYIAKKEPNGCE